MSEIVQVHAREILDSRGNPTLEAEVVLQDGARGRGAVPGAVGAAAGVAAVALAPAPAAGRQRACQNCGVAGHYAKTCTQPCAVCGVQGHGKSSCPQQPSRSMGDAMV